MTWTRSLGGATVKSGRKSGLTLVGRFISWNATSCRDKTVSLAASGNGLAFSRGAFRNNLTRSRRQSAHPPGAGHPVPGRDAPWHRVGDSGHRKRAGGGVVLSLDGAPRPAP